MLGIFVQKLKGESFFVFPFLKVTRVDFWFLDACSERVSVHPPKNRVLCQNGATRKVNLLKEGCTRWFKPWPWYPRSLEVTVPTFPKGHVNSPSQKGHELNHQVKSNLKRRAGKSLTDSSEIFEENLKKKGPRFSPREAIEKNNNPPSRLWLFIFHALDPHFDAEKWFWSELFFWKMTEPGGCWMLEVAGTFPWLLPEILWMIRISGFKSRSLFSLAGKSGV